MHHRGWVSLIVPLALLALCACGGGSSSPSATPSGQDSVPSLSELQAKLTAEFERLGIDPEKVPAQAPRKDENAVFDLAAELVDPDGAGGDPPTGITLAWTERIIADYNQDGMVTQNDLTPIGQNYCFDSATAQVTYDDPADHAGLNYWPTGDPDDGADGALNWRLGIIDGNNDGRILMHDITPIAVHYEERLTGYRIWRKAPGGSFVQIPNPEDAGSDVTLARPDTISQSAPVRYSFTDNEATSTGLGDGSYAYYVQPWDGTSATSGPVSAVVVIDNTGTVVPEQPVAQLTITPDFAGAPAVITLDASASTDSDGTVEAWYWDFDADGLTDWVSTDAVPESSTDGTVDTITPVSDGVVTVTYREGSAQWYFPGVMVQDNDGLSSTPVYRQLGISGWETELITHHEDPTLNFDPRFITVDPITDQVVIYGFSTQLDGNEGDTFSIAWREGPGQWHEEHIIDTDTHEYFAGVEGSNVMGTVVWDADGSPLAFVDLGRGLIQKTYYSYLAKRTGDGVWTSEPLYEWGDEVSGCASEEFTDIEDGHVISAIHEGYASEIPNGSGYRFQLVEYKSGGVSINDTVVEQDGSEDLREVFQFMSVKGGSTPVYSSYFFDSDAMIWYFDMTKITIHEQVSTGNWNDVILPPSTWGLDSYLWLNGIFRDPNGKVYLQARQQAADDTTSAVLGWYLLEYPSGEAIQLWSPDDPPLDEYLSGQRRLIVAEGSINWFTFLDLDYSESIGIKYGSLLLRFEGDTSITEMVYEAPVAEDQDRGSTTNAYVSDDGTRVHAIISGNNLADVPHSNSTDNMGFLLGTRIDPRY